MTPLSEILPHFDLAAFSRVAEINCADPEVFARMNRHGPVASPPFYKKFDGGAAGNACLIQRNSPVLMVAHVDTVRIPSGDARFDEETGRIYHNSLDNRLGVYLGLEVLPAMGLHVDLLLTTNEESGASTSALVHTRKEYQWMFSFDRVGEGVVCYQYERAPLSALLSESGFEVGTGSYSCVADLEHLGCCGMNFGCGMHAYHSDSAYCEARALARQLQKFTDFYGKYADLYFPHARREESATRRPHPWAVPVESLIWQIEYHRARGAADALEGCLRSLARLLGYAPELRAEFARELTLIPEVARDPADRSN